MPELSHWWPSVFPFRADEITRDEEAQYLDRLKELPPLGGMYQYRKG